MKSNALKLVYAALFGTAIAVSPGCSGTSGSDDRSLRLILGLLQNLIDELINTLQNLTGVDLSGLRNTLDNILNGNNGGLGDLTNIINSGQVGGLLNLGGSNSGTVNSLVGSLTNLVQGLTGQNLLGGNSGILSVPNAASSVDQVQVSQVSSSDALLQQAQALKTVFAQGLPGGLSQLTDGMHALGVSATSLAGQVVGTDDRATAVRALLQGIGNLLGNQADIYDAIGNLDGAAYASAEESFLDSLNTMATALPNGTGSSLLIPIENTRVNFQSTRLPIIKAVMGSLAQTQAGAGGQFRVVMSGLVTGNLDKFGGKSGLQRLVDTAANNVTIPDGQTPLGNLQTGVSNLGNLTGPLAGLNQGGLPAVNDILDPAGTLPNFASLIPQIPGFAGSTPNQVGSLISTVLTPGVGGVLPINSLAGTGLLSGNVLGNLTQIGSVLGGLSGSASVNGGTTTP